MQNDGSRCRRVALCVEGRRLTWGKQSIGMGADQVGDEGMMREREKGAELLIMIRYLIGEKTDQLRLVWDPLARPVYWYCCFFFFFFIPSGTKWRSGGLRHK